MQIFRRKPFMLCCFCFIASFLVSYCLIGKIKYVIAASAFFAAFVTGLTIVFLKKKRALRIKLAVLLIALLMSGAAASEAYFYYDVYLTSIDKYTGKECYTELTLIEERYASVESSEYLARVDSVNDESFSGTVLVEFEGECGFGEGQKIRAYSEILSLEEYAFNNKARLAYVSDGIMGGFFVSAESESYVIGASEKSNMFLSANRSLVHRLEDLLEGEEGRLASALFLGRKDRLSDETARDFGRAGLSHALALSGMHISILAGFIDIILRKTGTPKFVRCLVLPFIMLGYLALTGFSLSTVRAVIMLTAVCLSYIIASPIDKLTVLFASCAGIIAVSPSSIADIGFWMSYLATFGLILMSPYLSKLLGNRTGYGKKRKASTLILSFLKQIFNSVLITVTAVISVIFLTQMYFGEISLVSPISNLLCGFAITVFFVLSLLLALLGGIPLAEKLLIPTTKFVGAFILNCASRLSDIENVTLSLKQGYSYVIIFAFTAAMAVLFVVKVKKKIFLLLPAAVCIISLAVCMTASVINTKDTAELLYLRRGEREMIVLVEDGEAAFIDVSDGNYSNYRSAWDKAHSMGATELDTFVITHYHSKHIYSLSNLMSDLKVRLILAPRPVNKEEAMTLSEIYRISAEHGTKCGLYEREEQVSVLSEVKFSLFPSELLDRSVQPTVAFGIEYGEGKLTYVGSSYFESEYGNKADEYILDSDIVIYGTHGPNPKALYSVDSAINADEIIFADPELAELAYSSDGALKSKNIICDCEIRKFTIRKMLE